MENESSGYVIVVNPAGKVYRQWCSMSLQALQNIVHGDIEAAGTTIGSDCVMLVNGQGKLMNLPLNRRATAIYSYRTKDRIHGTAVIVSADGENLRGFRDRTSETLVKYLIKYYSGF